MLKEDARRRKLREASDRLEQAWANLAAQTSVLPFREHPALHGEGVPQYVLDWFDHDAARRILARARRQPAPRSHRRARAACFRLVRHVSQGQRRRLSRVARSRGDAAAREHQYLIAGPWVHIPWGDRDRRGGFRRRGAAGYRRDSAALVQSLAEGFRRIRARAAHPPFRARGEPLARSGGFSRPRRNHISICTAKAERIRARAMARSPTARPPTTSRATFSSTIPKCRCSRRAGRPRRAGSSIKPRSNWATTCSSTRAKPLAEPLARFRHAARVSLLRHFVGAHRFHRETRPREAERRGGIHLHRHRALELSFRQRRIRRGYDSSLGIRSRAHVVPFRGGRAHPARNRQQRISALRPQSRHAVPSCRATSWDWRRSTQFVYHDAKHPSALYLPVIEAAA